MDGQILDSSGSRSQSSTTEAMASLLLSGWAMMSETCDECPDVPLMRSRAGVFKCCRCNKERRSGVPEPPSGSTKDVSSGVAADGHKYRIVDECGLDSRLVDDIHGADGDKVLCKQVASGHCSRRAPVEGRRLQQLCLLRVELTKSVDRYTTMLHHINEGGSLDPHGDSQLLDSLERALRLLDMVDSMI
ncbi:sjogren s syndrome scleroderma autoantigen 1, putative [Babesia ovis]|uniref:Sjogren s syndrome scleroderma autoantigen 1, putative n=1 Tax=Babesia ovis TaxID=5869 RepID=A0A9W5WV28_BABOV|nr:sjogren s syndrome scleroderma autoantigen 1, putative [Babesia ovis]GFE53881.1 sjogren s syndrome scleroderma autoantigen 1, putative [Babesia ovis]